MWGGGSRYSVCVGVVVSITYISGNAFKLFAGLPLTRHAIGVKTCSKCVHNIHTIYYYDANTVFSLHHVPATPDLFSSLPTLQVIQFLHKD